MDARASRTSNGISSISRLGDATNLEGDAAHVKFGKRGRNGFRSGVRHANRRNDGIWFEGDRPI